MKASTLSNKLRSTPLSETENIIQLSSNDLIEKNILGKTVLISGAGGSIGSELCRQILQVGPKQLLLLDHNEFGLYVIEAELRAYLNSNEHLKTELVPILGNVRDTDRLESIFSQWKIDTVYHAAAYKHVPLVEHNPSEGLQNNVLGTLNLAQVAKKHHKIGRAHV